MCLFFFLFFLLVIFVIFYVFLFVFCVSLSLSPDPPRLVPGGAGFHLLWPLRRAHGKLNQALALGQFFVSLTFFLES